MKTTNLFLFLLFAVSCGYTFAQDRAKVDWDAAYKRLLEADEVVRKKIDSGQATKEDVINWLKNQKGDAAKQLGKKESAANAGNAKDLTAFKNRLAELVKSGKLSKADAAKLAATMESKGAVKGEAKKEDLVDWDAEYEKLMANPTARGWIEKQGISKAEVIEFLKGKAVSKGSKGKTKGGKGVKPGGRMGRFQFYSLVIGRLHSKDIELGELEIDVDYVISEYPEVNSDLIGKRVKLVGVSGQFIDALLKIKRGETIKVRTGNFNPETRVLGFGYKFHVLERTAPFKPGDFGVPPKEFRGFSGELIGKIVEAVGYEVLLEVKESNPADGSQAKDAASIVGKRIRIAGFFNQHSDAFSDLSEGDEIRVSVTHRDTKSDSIDVTDKLETVE
ncbi:hypothetical protein [Novipirellula artificiosorum]|uniref:Uncharacterized protein n=1 Tax=Novipirellula artificiosorum TaxID=2528016 RepID=A0A5C6DSR1_9BACT|nr:hypothetical protein [Novipirellula artificiosorum]TWU38531.1 hypothetical protein Poly41_30080 [Novipirellula artificiosorum]